LPLCGYPHNGKSRQVPIHPSTVVALRRYARRRDTLSPAPGEQAFFIQPGGSRLSYANAQRTFRCLVGHAGLTPHSQQRPPTIHGLRHSFAVNTLVGWYRDGADVQARLPLLSTVLGHADPKWTYWYLSACPELLELAAERLDATLGRLP
jgi:integrase/recombinase XerD